LRRKYRIQRSSFTLATAGSTERVGMHGVHYVFHGTALKQVPRANSIARSCHTNILALKTIEAAIRGVSRACKFPALTRPFIQ
jgi:FlaA1/EpsC-like NDP-sugar epimerase